MAAFLLAITALFLPWWRVTYETGGLRLPDTVSPFRPESPLTTTWGPWLTGMLVGVAALLLFLRIAGRSDRYEPRVWRRDLRVAGILLGLAGLSAVLWPAGVPSFWGGRTYTAENVTTEVHEAAMPVLGWWLALLGAGLLLVAWRLAPRSGESDKPPGTAPPTTDK